MYCHWRPSYSEWVVGIPLTGLTLPHLCACPKTQAKDHDFQRHMSWSFLCVQRVELRWEVIVHFVDIDKIDDHHCLSFLFIIIVVWAWTEWFVSLWGQHNLSDVLTCYHLKTLYIATCTIKCTWLTDWLVFNANFNSISAIFGI